jgi:hypothetical protein
MLSSGPSANGRATASAASTEVCASMSGWAGPPPPPGPPGPRGGPDSNALNTLGKLIHAPVADSIASGIRIQNPVM